MTSHTFGNIISIHINQSNTSKHIIVFTKIVLLTCESYPATLNESRAYAISCACAVSSPSTHSSSVFSEGICDTVNSLCSVSVKLIIIACIAVHCERCAAIDVVVTLICTHILPALYKLTVNSVIEIVAYFNYTCTKNSNVAASSTNKLCVNYTVIMSLGFNNRTKVNDRLTGLTICSACESCFCTCCFLISDSSQLCIMNVVRRRDSCKLGCYVDGTCEGVTVNNTVNNFYFNVDNRLVAHFGYGIILTCNSTVAVISPNSYGNAYESIVKRSADRTGSFNGNGKELGNLVILKSSCEAISNDSALGCPSVRVVEFENCNKLICICEVCNVNIYVVDRLSLRSLAGVVVTAELNRRITCNSKCSGNSHGITKFVLNFKCNGVNTGSKSNVTLRRERVTCDSNLNLHAINKDLTGGKVKSNIIRYSCGECNIITCDSSTVFKRNCYVRGRISGIGYCRKYSVINSRAVVESNIVNVESNYIRSIGFYISTDEGRRTGVRLVRRRDSRQIVVLADINGSIDPTGFGNICIGSRVQVRLLAGSSRSKHEVILHTRCFSVNCPVCIGIELRLERKTLAC